MATLHYVDGRNPYNTLELQCLRVPGSALTPCLERLSAIVCKHLDIAIFTARDIKRILKTNSGGEVIRKLVRCVEENEGRENVRVLGGILTTILHILKDAVLSQEIYRPNLHHFVFRCFDMRPLDPELRDLLVSVVAEFLIAPGHAPGYSHDVAVRCLAKMTPLIHAYTDNDTKLQLLFVNIRMSLFKVRFHCGHHLSHSAGLASPSIDTLELPYLAKTIVGLLTDAPTWLIRNQHGHISDILVWISYHQPEAILDLHSNQGSLFFAACNLTSSVALRCRGFVGLMNLHYLNDTSDERFYEPRRSFDERRRNLFPEELQILNKSTVLEKFLQSRNEREVEEILHDTSVTDLIDGVFYNPYDAALRYVGYELLGPQATDQSFIFPNLRSFGIPDLGDEPDDLIDELEMALRVNKKVFEAEVLRLGFTMILIKDMTDKKADTHEIQKLSFSARMLAQAGMKKWPDRSYFYWAAAKTHGGIECREWVERGLQCSDCTPHMRRRMLYEVALNAFSTSVISLALELNESVSWRLAAECLKSAKGRIEDAIELSRGSPEEKLLIVFLYVTELMVKGATSPSLVPLEKNAIKAMSTLAAVRYPGHMEFLKAVADFLLNREKARKQWSTFLAEVPNSKSFASDVLRFDDPEAEGLFWDNRIDQVSRWYEQKTVNDKQLPLCTGCGTSSLGLRKCSRCEKARYCDKLCQTSDWKRHKKECLSSEIAS
ncbi:hypothetical protein SISSUDRAFT_1121463 [Sistotremastrum suecicum HHB10207 ss-3]|uniref:MYND-type domain-containing protein n=1 Tax=Sistotremastrum suecicum HHB10207 ss-3 TaxID=1314776 RepID=A0A166ATK1_9AGAM|nr:hypothetical protein SISSUDRAFT_1121463 [Sistotremastrum suecicum HHB10207 ss-3]